MAQDASSHISTVIPSRLSRKRIYLLLDKADWEQALWELVMGYDWPAGNEIPEALGRFPRTQTKEQQIATLAGMKRSERRQKCGVDASREDFLTEPIQKWLSSFREGVQQAASEGASESLYWLFQENLRWIQPSLNRESADDPENYLARELWLDFIFGRFTLNLSTSQSTTPAFVTLPEGGRGDGEIDDDAVEEKLPLLTVETDERRKKIVVKDGNKLWDESSDQGKFIIYLIESFGKIKPRASLPLNEETLLSRLKTNDTTLKRLVSRINAQYKSKTFTLHQLLYRSDGNKGTFIFTRGFDV